MSPLALLATTTFTPSGDADLFKDVVGQANPAACVDRTACDLILEWTGNASLAKALAAIVEPLFEVFIVVLLMVIGRALLRRVVGMVVTQMKQPVGTNAFHKLADKVDGGHDARPVSADRRKRRAESMGALMRSIGSAVIWTMGVLMILGAFNINLAPLIAGAGIVGVALGFGAQDLVKDFLSGVFMLIEDQYGVGDTVDVGDAAGIVEGISLRTTRIRDVEGRLWHVPNGEIRRVANSSQAWARALLDVDIAYGADIDDAIKVIEAAGRQMALEEKWDALFLEEPEVWGVQNLAADSIQLRIVIKTKAGEQFGVGRELRRRIKYALDAAEIEIPFQQRTIWLRSDDGTELMTKKSAKKATTKKATAKKATAKKAPATTSEKKANKAAAEAKKNRDEPEARGAQAEV